MSKKRKSNPKHPIQPLVVSDGGVIRFKANKIVQYLLDNGGIDLNQLACMDFSQEDREQFAQLIGYSHSGAADLSYFSDETWEAAQAMYEHGETDAEARLRVLQERLEDAKNGMRTGVARLFGVHPEDLTRR